MNEILLNSFLDELDKLASSDQRIRLIVALAPELAKDAGWVGKTLRTIAGKTKKLPVRAKIIGVTDPRTMVTSTAKGARKSITPKKLMSVKEPKGPFDTPDIMRLSRRGLYK